MEQPRPRALVVENDTLVGAVISAFLEELGFDVEVVQDAGSALDHIGMQLPDLLVSDVMLEGGMNGGDLAVRVRQAHPGLPVLLTSGYDRGSLPRSCDGFRLLQKPYTFECVASAVSEAAAATPPVEPAAL